MSWFEAIKKNQSNRQLFSGTHIMWVGADKTNFKAARTYFKFVDKTHIPSKNIITTDWGTLSGTAVGMASCVAAQKPGGRFIRGGGGGSSIVNIIDYIENVNVDGTWSDLADLSGNRFSMAAFGNDRAAYFFGGKVTGTGSPVDIVDKFLYYSAANATDIANMASVRHRAAGYANTRKGMFGGGQTGNAGTIFNDVDEFFFSSEADTVQVGNLTTARRFLGAAGNEKRIIFAGGDTSTSSGIPTNEMDFLYFDNGTFTSDMGNLLAARYAISGAASQTEAIFSYGAVSGGTAWHDDPDMVLIDSGVSAGNGRDWGNHRNEREGPGAYAGG